MQTNYTCPGCGRGVQIVSTGDLPVQINDQGVTSIEVSGVRYPLKNEAGESLQCFKDGKPVYWTPPAPPANPPPLAPTEPVPTH